jgi:hypothetical protein
VQWMDGRGQDASRCAAASSQAIIDSAKCALLLINIVLEDIQCCGLVCCFSSTITFLVVERSYRNVVNSFRPFSVGHDRKKMNLWVSMTELVSSDDRERFNLFLFKLTPYHSSTNRIINHGRGRHLSRSLNRNIRINLLRCNVRAKNDEHIIHFTLTTTSFSRS